MTREERRSFMGDPVNLRETYIQEAEELLGQIEERILDLETDPTDSDAVNGLLRAMHTVKGSGAMFGFEDIASFAHHVETALELVRNGELSVTKELIDLTLASRDQIKAMLDEARGGQIASRDTAQEIVDAFARLMRTAPETVADSGRREVFETQESKGTSKSTYRIRFRPALSILASGLDPVLIMDELRGLGLCHITPLTDDIPELIDLDPEQCYLSFVVILTTRYSLNRIWDVFIFVEDTSEIDIALIDEDNERIPRIGDILVERGDTTRHSIAEALSQQTRLGDILLQKGEVKRDQITSALAEQQVLRKKREAMLKETIRVPAEKMDQLVNLVGELVITQAQLQSAASTIDHSEFCTPVEEIGRLTTEIKDIALNVRMMPIGGTFNRFRRFVRDLSSELGKRIRLETFGAETEMDKTIIEKMGDLLVHLIRNSIDHGIESPEKRWSIGKPEEGTIRLSARHEGTEVVISIEDDGRGMDPEEIRKIAVEKGIIGENGKLSLQEALALTMSPGFSTAREVSNISGRGVGMDVVKKGIKALRGVAEISSEKDVGTRIRMSLPLTLAIIDGLLVSVGVAKYIIPIVVVTECLEVTNENLIMDQRRNLLMVRGDCIPFVRLREVFQIDDPAPGIEKAVIVEAGDIMVGIVVDQIVGDHQTVIKSLGKLYRNAVGVSGATILGDGTVALIADIPSILKIADMQEKKHVRRKKKVSSLQQMTLH
jgi:two-component system, chemotaxis family, sensor kinase CheA